MKNTTKSLVLLHGLLMIYSLSSVLSKKASAEAFLSVPFCMYYAGIIFLMMIYAIGWQQIIKKMPLTLAFANKAVAVVWGIVWGFLLFAEKITLGKIIECFSCATAFHKTRKVAERKGVLNFHSHIKYSKINLATNYDCEVFLCPNYPNPNDTIP
ncbi:MAG: hypothetical protein Q4D29_12650 [Lachnospiraceae bacterium]|nr:hypothetical protein [Lachnospiraceae bacterium]